MPTLPAGPPSADELFPLVYDELRRLAHHYMRQERPGQTLQATALVNEVYVRLAGRQVPWAHERHFVNAASRAMRRILVDRARARGAEKRWAGLERVSIAESLAFAAEDFAMLPAVDRALTRLETIAPEQARIIELRFFGGLTNEETAAAMGMSVGTVKRRFAFARAWLFRELAPEL